MSVATRLMQAGAATIRVSCPDDVIRTVVEQLFVDLADGRGTPTEFAIRTVGGDRFDLLHPERTMRNMRLPEVFKFLVTGVSRAALDEDPERLHLHAATVSRGGRGVVISAASGAGKSTLAGALAERGWDYLSDETAILERGSRTIRGFPKPMSFKPGGFEVLSSLESARVGLPGAEETTDWWHIPASRLGAPIATQVDPAVIVVLHAVPNLGGIGEEVVVKPLHAADAVVHLMSQTMDPVRFGEDTVDQLASLAAGCTCVSMQVGPIGEGVRVVEQAIQAAVPTLDVELIAQGEASVTPWRPDPMVRSIAVGDRVVVNHVGSGAIAALDESAAAIWLAICGHPPDWWSPATLDLPHSVEFVARLAEHGFVHQVDQGS